MHKIIIILIFFVSSVWADERTEILEQEIQKLTNKVEILEHEVRLLKQHSSSASTSVDTNVESNASVQSNEVPQAQPAALPKVAEGGTSEKQVYDLALATLKDKKYEAAKENFADFISAYPKSALLDRVMFWYAESYFGQKDYQNSALHYLKCYQKYPKGPKAQDALLKLSMSLSELKRKTEVCKIIKKLEQEFPNRSANTKKIASDLKLKHSCK